jgi:transposase-like protein
MVNVKVDFDMSKIKRAVGQKVAQSDLEVPCPECGARNKVKGGDIAAQRTITCSGCRKTIKLNDKGGSFGRMIRGQ